MAKKQPDTEIWKDIVGFEGIYQVSSFGRIKSINRISISKYGTKRVLKETCVNPHLNSIGRFRVILRTKGKYDNRCVSRLVATAFIPNPNGFRYTTYINGVLNDNRVENIKWTSSKSEYISFKSKISLSKESKIDDLLNESWKYVIGYSNRYMVSSLGRVKSKYAGREKLLFIGKNKKGYPTVTLCENGEKKMFPVHRLVSKLFLTNHDKKTQVNHINGIKTDNRVDNLEWCTPSENVRHSYDVLGKIHNTKGKLNRIGKKVARYNMNGVLIDIFPSTMEVERQLGISNTNVGKSSRINFNSNKAVCYNGNYIFSYFINAPKPTIALSEKLKNKAIINEKR